MKIPKKGDSFIYGKTFMASRFNTKTINGNFILFILILFFFIASLVASMTVWFTYRMYQTLPTVSQLGNIEPPLASRVFDKDSVLIHEFSVELRFWTPLEKIPKHLINAVVAIEDRRFYEHWGIDIKRIFGAAMVNIFRKRLAQGASTITQQLARNVYLTSKTSIIRKIREALTAIQLEMYYTKEEILELYLNQVYLGAGVYGVEAAAQRYFGKSISELNLNECATLAGIIQLPEYYRPDKKENYQRILNRRKAVVNAMKSMKYIDATAEEAINREPIPCSIKKQPSLKAPYFVELVRQYIEQKYGSDILYNGGLQIYTTLDASAQDSTEKAIKQHLPKIQTILNKIFIQGCAAHRKLNIPYDTFVAHFDSIYSVNADCFKTLPDSLKHRIAQVCAIALDVETGGILMLVGGRNFEESKYNRAIQALRQPGSAFKPFVYTAAIDSGAYTPASIIYDQPITIMTPEGEWRPENYEKEFYGPVTLRFALAKSINLVAILVCENIGAEKVVSYARRMKLTTPLSPVPSIAIGSCEVKPIELVSAYSVFPNKGMLAKPYFINCIIDKRGKILEKHTPAKERILSPQTAYLMCDLLSTVVCCGTAATIPGLGFTRPAGGKTGTTNKYTDAWFIGFTPQITCGVWLGVDEKRSMGRVTGAEGAVPVWVASMKALHKKLPVEYFDRPNGIVSGKICSASNELATTYCTAVKNENFLAGFLPAPCRIHGPQATGKKAFIKSLGSKKPTEAKNKKPLIF